MSNPLLEVPATLWRQLVSELAEAGGGFKEAGAFLLGQREPRRRVVDYELYSTIAPRSQEVDYVFLLGTDLARMWEECAHRGVGVVADVHTHPGGPRQSFSDRAHPIVAVPGAWPRRAHHPQLCAGRDPDRGDRRTRISGDREMEVMVRCGSGCKTDTDGRLA
jgi:proteasome lid subunit RPN8/RPN11